MYDIKEYNKEYQRKHCKTHTAIIVTRKTKDELDKIVENKRETYDSLVLKLLKHYKETKAKK